MADHPEKDQYTRRFLRALRDGDLQETAFDLGHMIRSHLARYPQSEDMLTIFITAHLTMGLDISGYLELMEGVPIEPIIQSEVHRFMEEYRNDPESECALAERILRRISAFSRTDPFRSGITLLKEGEEEHPGLVRAVCSYLESHFSDPETTVTHTAQRFGVSVSYLSRTFHRSTGMKLGDYILLLRFDEASRLLRTTDLSVAEVAERCGFSGCSAFIRSYRNKEGMTPGAYRRRMALSEKIERRGEKSGLPLPGKEYDS